MDKFPHIQQPDSMECGATCLRMIAKFYGKEYSAETMQNPRFEYTHELAWKVMKDYAEYQGYTDIRGSRGAIRKTLQIGLIEDKRWMETIKDRNLTSYNYDDDVASEIYENIVQVYYPLFCRFEERMLCMSENETR